MRQIGWISRWMGVAVAAALAFAPQGLSAAGAAQAIGVPDFAARPSTPTMSGLNPGRFAADAATMQLTRAAHPAFTVIPRTTITQAQTALNWRDNDITRLPRLTELANRVGATRLVIGTIDRITVDQVANNLYRCTATVTLQIFTLAPAKATSTVTGMGSGTGRLSRDAAQQALQEAIEQAVKAELGKLAPTR